MGIDREGKLSHEREAFVKAVSQIAKEIGQKLSAIHFLRDGEDDEISHHLAEVAYLGLNLSSRIIPRFLVAEGDELQDVSADLHWDLREIKEAIESMEADLQRLMNHLNP